jgi:nucleoside phosphorylase
LTMKLIQNFRPRYLIMTGIMASTKDKSEGSFGFGDIILTDECWDGGAGKISEDNQGGTIFQASAKHLTLNADIKEIARSYQLDATLFNNIREKSILKPKTVLELHIGPTTSVAGVIENSEVIKQLKSHDRKLLGLDMETYGVFYAANNCSNPKPVAISIKSISDFADTAKNDQFQQYAAYTSAYFMYHFVLNEL